MEGAPKPPAQKKTTPVKKRERVCERETTVTSDSVTPVSATVSTPVVYPEGWNENATLQGEDTCVSYEEEDTSVSYEYATLQALQGGKYYHHAAKGVTQLHAPHGWPAARHDTAAAAVATVVAASAKHTEDAAGASPERAPPSEANRTASETGPKSCVSSTNHSTTTTDGKTGTTTQGHLGQSVLEMNANAQEEREAAESKREAEKRKEPKRKSETKREPLIECAIGFDDTLSAPAPAPAQAPAPAAPESI